MHLNRVFVIHRRSPSEARSDAFVNTAFVVCVVWAVAALGLIALVALFAAEHLRETVVISLLSGLVALVSLVPGIVNEVSAWFTPEATAKASEQQNYLGPLFGGIILRMLATVALFVLCRYQLAGSVRWIAALTIGWYVVLTCTEVFVLARVLPRQGSGSPADSSTNGGPGHRESSRTGVNSVLPVAMIAEL